MTYATQQDLVDRFGQTELVQLTDKELPLTGAIVAAVAARALAAADARIDGYLAGRYALPLAAVPPAIVEAACDIARFRLYEDRATEHIQKLYDDAVAYLVKLGTGKLSLTLAGGAPAPKGDGAQMESSSPVFKRGDSGDFI
jgi:phage gp36-like protein